MSTSFPYLSISRCIGATYGRVLAIAGKFDVGCSVSDISDPMAGNVYRVWREEHERRAQIEECSPK